MIVFVVFILLRSIQAYCLPIQLQETRVKRTVFDLIPSGVLSADEDR
jgi:hypothetical protein